MSENIQLNIISNDDTLISEEISELYIPAYYGVAGILENHLPFISILGAGEVSYRDMEGKKNYLFVDGGFLENKNNKIFIITENVIRGEDLNKEVLESEYEEVEKDIKSSLKGELTSEELEIKIKEQKVLKSKLNIIEKLK